MKNKLNNLIGQKFGLLTVVKRISSKNHQTIWEVRCDCGNTSTTSSSHLKTHHTTSCGCRKGHFKHGLARTKKINGVTREYKMWNGAKSHSMEAKLKFSITPFDIHIPKFCPLLGVKLNPSAGIRADNLPSLDRIDTSKGYTPENIWVVSWRANRIKHACSLQELQTLVKNLEQKVYA